MTGQELLNKLILHLNQYLAFNDSSVIEKIEDDEDFSAGARIVLGLRPTVGFSDFIKSLINIYTTTEASGEFLNDPIIVSGNTHIIDFTSTNLLNKNRAFAYSDADFGFFSSKYLFDSGNLRDFSLDNYSLLWKQIQEYCERCYSLGNNTLVEEFFDCIGNASILKGFVIKKDGLSFDDEKHYSYVYLSYLNNSKFLDIPTELRYSSSILNSTLTLDSSKSYEQYFDVYDVFNEVNMSGDILSRFLKLYHSLEYLIYRVYLVELANKVGSSKLFVREFINASESMKKDEKGSFKKTLK